MIVHAKVGTQSLSVIKIGFKRKPPIVGDRIKFRAYPEEAGEKWRTAKIDLIKDVGFLVYYLSL